MQQNRRLAFAAYLYSIRKLQALYYAGDYSSAIEAEAQAGRLLSQSPSYSLYFDTAEYCFYGALARAAFCHLAPTGERSQHIEMLRAHHKQLQTWVEDGPENLVNRVALIGAEIAWLDGHELAAEYLYEQAIRSARANGFVHNEALAYETAARFYAARGFETFADVYLREARDGDARWGAGWQGAATRGPPSTLARDPAARRERETAVAGSAARRRRRREGVAGAVQRNAAAAVGRALMTIAVQNAGADRGLLILPHGVIPH